MYVQHTIYTGYHRCVENDNFDVKLMFVYEVLVSNSHSVTGGAANWVSYGQAKHSHYTVHGLILPSNCTTT